MMSEKATDHSWTLEREKGIDQILDEIRRYPIVTVKFETVFHPIYRDRPVGKRVILELGDPPKESST